VSALLVFVLDYDATFSTGLGRSTFVFVSCRNLTS